MRQHVRLIVAAAVLFALLPVLALAQSSDIAPDDRYRGYPSSLVSFPPSLPDLKACVAQEYYEPLDVHLMRYTSRVKVASVRTQEYDECTWMRTRNGDRWVLRPKGTQVAQDAQGRDLFDYGSSNGKQCGNSRPVSIPVKPEPVVIREEPIVVPPPLVPPPPPEPQRLVTVLIPKLWLKGDKELDPPKGWSSVTFIGQPSERDKIRGHFDGTKITFVGVEPGSALVIRELGEVKGFRDQTQRLVVRIPEGAPEVYRIRDSYVNERRGSVCGKYAWRCWVPPLGAGVAWALLDKDRGFRRINREPIKGGDGRPTNPGGSP